MIHHYRDQSELSLVAREVDFGLFRASDESFLFPSFSFHDSVISFINKSQQVEGSFSLSLSASQHPTKVLSVSIKTTKFGADECKQHRRECCFNSRLINRKLAHDPKTAEERKNGIEFCRPEDQK